MAPAMLLGLWAQMKIHTTYAAARQQAAPLSGAAAARYILDSAGLNDVVIEETPGSMTDHYDPQAKVLRLSSENYRTRSLAAVGVAAHEAGHALQDAQAYAPMAMRNVAVSAANFGSSGGLIMLIVGALFHLPFLLWAGIALFSMVAVYQVVNLPVEFDASNRAKRQLVQLGIVPAHEMTAVNQVLNAAAWTYVAATLQSILMVLYYVMRFSGGERD
jgi:Zn-dependent membrane protease YugP